jgi:mannosyltransferase OCH1-like enzyme
MIPKKIHYCWFGRNPLPKSAKKCIASWKKYMPDYEIIEWNEDNFDINMNAYTKMCYEQKKYAFLSDYIRLLVIEEHGGIYFDTDVEAVRSFDDLLENGVFLGFETDQYVNTGEGFGAEAYHPVVQQMIKEYEILLDGEHGTVGCPHLNTNALLKFGLKQNGRKQMIGKAMIYPADYFNPLNSATGKLERTENTYSIHWYSMSWMSSEQKVRSKITRVFHRIFGENCFRFLKKGV